MTISHSFDFSGIELSAQHGQALTILRDFPPKQIYYLTFEENPQLLMEALTLELRNQIYWEIVENTNNRWVVKVQHRHDVEATDLRDLLTRDHFQIDRTFATALHHCNAGNLDLALPSFHEYAQRLRRHVEAENDLIVPVLDLPRSSRGDDPTSIMLREHDDILEQTILIENMIKEGIDDASILATFMAIISGQLAKHEGREENNLFPLWSRLLHHDSELAAELFPKVKVVILDPAQS